MPGTGADTHHEKATYDQLGRPFQAFDASRTEARFDHNGVRYAYSAHGHLERLQDAVGTLDGGGTFTPSAAYRTVTAMDARGNVTAETLGNGVKRTHAFDGRTGRLLGIEAGKSSANGLQDLAYQWDALGNLKSRARNVGASTLTETFGYDGLNRLKTHQAGSGTVQSTAYDGYGNIRSRTGVGTYAYGADSGGSGRPHAVASVTSGGTAVTHAYDANGSNVSSSDGRTIAYAAFGKATSIAKGGSKSEFAYGPNRSRFKRVDTDGGGDVTTTLYLGNVERITLPGGTVETKRYIGGVAILTTGPARGSCPANATQYVLRDHLGSVDELLDAQGRKARSMAFAAWGERANPADLAPLPGAEAASFDACATTRGFTGHEMLDAVGAVHMNGRIHDPALGRFLQADPFVQFPGNLQSHNRYSYALNNPLAYTDPSGHFIFSLAATAYLAGAKAGIATIVATVAAAGFGDALLQGASFGQALRAGFLSGVSAAAFSGIGSGLEARFSGGFAAGLSPWGFGLKVLAHGAVGGITSTLGGGRFGHGFAAAGFTALGTSFNNSRHVGGLGFSPLRVAMGAAIGGTASRITGGKFANGAVTGAFSQAFNNEQAEAELKQRVDRLVAIVQEEYGDILEAGKIDLRKNIMLARKMGIFDFIGKVAPRQPWDYKRTIDAKALGLDPAKLAEFGNLHYAIVAAASGHSKGFTLSGAGGSQTFLQGGGSVLEFIAPYLAPFAFAPSSLEQLHPGGMDRELYLRMFPMLSTEGANHWLESGGTFGDLPEDNTVVEGAWDMYHGL